jgi:hypothetical protein
MNCLNCYENYIFFKYEKNGTTLKNCYLINENKTKNFFEPDISDKIISCKNFNKYIIENTNECIEKPDEGYYISNSFTGLLSPCHYSCKTCSNKMIDNNSNCIDCIDGYYPIKEEILNNCYNNENKQKRRAPITS